MSPMKTPTKSVGPPFKRTGSVLAGWMHSSWPLATLHVSETEVRLKAFLLGTYKFRPDQVVRLEAGRSVLFAGSMRIHHTVPDYPRRIVSSCFGGTPRLIEQIHATGFIPCARAEESARFQGLAVKWQTILVGVVLRVAVNVAAVIEHLLRVARGSSSTGPGISLCVAGLMLFLGSLAILWLRPVQRLPLKPERSVKEIRSVVLVFALASGITLFAVAMMAIVRALH